MPCCAAVACDAAPFSTGDDVHEFAPFGTTGAAFVVAVFIVTDNAVLDFAPFGLSKAAFVVTAVAAVSWRG